MSKNHDGYQFGAFKGVFTPSILTILGVVMYLRFGWVLGNVGLTQTLIIVTISCAITFITGLAISALATNMKIGPGGAYYIISRSLGLEIGGAIGIPLYLAQALGISFYVAGLSESIVAMWPVLNATIVGVIILFLLTGLALVSANAALKTQFFILVAIVLSLASYFLGDGSFLQNLSQSIESSTSVETAPFWIVFAVFFPAVTGIEAGISLSGDLKDPGKALARGTIGAVVVGYIVYLFIPIFMNSLNIPKSQLIENPMIMSDIARWGEAVILGLWGASISSSLGAILGAPRTLQALALDRVIPRFVGKGFGKAKEPRIATAISATIALAGILLGDLNLIAPILSMFFLTSYGLLNISAAIEAAIASPTWRPSLKLPWQVHAAGALACFFAMLMINTMATFVSIFVAIGFFLFMKQRNIKTHFGDLRHGLSMMMIQKGLKLIGSSKHQIRTWKPNILVLSGAPKARWYLIELANAISEGKSLMTVATVITGDEVAETHIQKMKDTIGRYLQKSKVDSMVTVLWSETKTGGLMSLVSSYGFGPLTPNTVMLGDTASHREEYVPYIKLLKRIASLNKNIIVVREDEKVIIDESKAKQVDIWWQESNRISSLMLAIGLQLKQSQNWKDHKVVIKTVVEKGSNQSDKMESLLKDFIENERLDASFEIIRPQSENTSVYQKIVESSRCSALTVLAMDLPNSSEATSQYDKYYEALMNKTKGLRLTAFVAANEQLPFKKLFDTDEVS